MKQKEKKIKTKMNAKSVKIVLVGDSYTGKTSLIQRLVNNEYVECSLSTVVSSCFNKTVKLPEKTMKISIWDTAGQERFKSLASNFFRDAQGIVICYDVNQPQSLSTVPSWIEEKERKANEDVCWMIVGCKSDMENQTDENELKQLIEKHNVMHMTCSSKTGENVEEIFVELCKNIQSHVKVVEEEEDDEPDLITMKQLESTIQIKEDNEEEEDESCC